MNEEEKNIQNSQDNVVNAIANSEARDENAEKVQGATQEKADFTSMFGVQSEETAEEKELAKPVIEIPRVLEVKQEEREIKVEISPEEKKANHKKMFNADEKLVYQIEEEKQGNPIVVVIFFTLLVVFIIILPQISKKYDFSQFFKTTINNNQDDEEEDIYLRIDSSARAKIGPLEMINFGKFKDEDVYTFTATIQNVSDKMYQFDKKYYIVLYDEQSNVVYYALIHSFNGIPAKNAEEIVLTLNQKAYDKGVKFKVEEIPTSKYPDVRLNSIEGEYRLLTCTYNHDTMTYYFQNNKLVKIREVYIETDESTNYSANLVKYKNLHEDYKKIENFETVFVEEQGRFSLHNEIDLSKISDNTMISLRTYRYFRYNTDKNTVSFEAQAQGYLCS